MNLEPWMELRCPRQYKSGFVAQHRTTRIGPGPLCASCGTRLLRYTQTGLRVHAARHAKPWHKCLGCGSNRDSGHGDACPDRDWYTSDTMGLEVMFHGGD